MKKLFVLLLALSMVVGVAFAQVTTAISLSGGVKLIDQDTLSKFEQDGPGYDTLTFKATSADGTYGFSMTDKDILGSDIEATASGIELRDWNVWYKLFGGKAKVTFGALRNGDYRTLLPNGKVDAFGATDRINVQGVLFQAYPVDGLDLGVCLPVSTTAKDTVDYTLSGIDFGAAYTIADIGKAILLVRLNDGVAADDTSINAGFSFTGVEGLTANVIGKFVTGDTTSDAYFAVGAEYAVTEALTAMAEFGLKDVADVTNWDIWARGKYVLTEMFYGYATFTINDASDYTVIATPGVDFGNGFSAELDIGYDSLKDFVYDVYLYYSIAF